MLVFKYFQITRLLCPHLQLLWWKLFLLELQLELVVILLMWLIGYRFLRRKPVKMSTNLLSHNGPYRHTIFGNTGLEQSFHSPNHQLWFCVHRCERYWCIQVLRTFWYYCPQHNHKCISLLRCFLAVQCWCICIEIHIANQHSHNLCRCILLHT